MIQDKIFFDEKDPTGLSYNTPFTVYGSYEGRLWSKTPSGEIKYYTQNSDLSVYATTGSNSFNGNQTVTGSLTVTEGITGTVTTASYVQYSNVADKPSGIVSSSVQVRGYNVFATTGSNQFDGSQSVTGSLTVTGQVIAQTLNVQEVTSSIVFSSGSNRFGNSLGNTQQFTGSVSVTGSLTSNGALTGTNAIFSSLEVFDNSNSGILKLSRDTGGQRGQLQFGRNNSGTFQVTGMIGSDSDTASPNNGTLYFYTSNSSGVSTERLIINGTGSATFNLGSGEMRLNRTGTSEYLKLNTYYLLTDGNDQLLGSVTGATSIYAGSGVSPKLTIASTGAATFQTTGNNGIINIGGSTYYSQLETNSTLGGLKIKSIWGAANSGIIQFINGTSENIRMHIADNGNVDIGLTNAIDRLTISRNVADNAGGITLYNAETSGYGSALTFRVNYAGVYNVSRIHGDWGTGNSGLLHFFTANTSQTLVERMLINGSGNVIIGNTTAYGGLTVSDFTTNDGNDSLAFFYRGTSGGHESLIKFYDFRGQVNAAMGNNLEDDGSGTQKARLVFKTSNSGAPIERMRITSGGQVQISNSILRLNASSTTSVSTSVTTISTDSNTYGGLAIIWGADSGGNIWTDLLFYSLGQVYVIRSQDVSGGPFGRTYSVDGSGSLRLAMGGGTYTVRYQALLTS
jgi:hypothetical protein